MTQETSSTPSSHQDENQIITERRAKLSALRQKGDAFPNTFRREHLAATLHVQYGEQP